MGAVPIEKFDKNLFRITRQAPIEIILSKNQFLISDKNLSGSEIHMSNGGGIIAGAIIFIIGIILIFVGGYILQISSEADDTPETPIEGAMQLPRAFGIAFIIGGILLIIMGIVVIIGSAR